MTILTNIAPVQTLLLAAAVMVLNSTARASAQPAQVLVPSGSFHSVLPEVLQDYAEYEQLNISGWHFMSSEAAHVQTLAMMLGVQYSKKSDGHFAHSNLVTVLDGQGRIAKRVEGLNPPMDKAAETIRSIIDKNMEQ